MSIFFHEYTEFAIQHDRLIQSIDIGFHPLGYSGQYGIRVEYVIQPLESELPSFQTALILNFHSKLKAAHFIFKPATNGNDELTLIEFNAAYSVASSATLLRLEQHFGENFPIKVMTTSYESLFNYTRERVRILTKQNNRYATSSGGFAYDTRRIHDDLIICSLKAKSLNTNDFKISDRELFEQCWKSHQKHYPYPKLASEYYKDQYVHEIIGIFDIRKLATKFSLPILVDNEKVVTEIWFRPSDILPIFRQILVEEIAKDQIESNYGNAAFRTEAYKAMITFIYNHHLKAEKRKLIKQQQKAHTKSLNIDKGDIIERKSDERLLVVEKFPVGREMTTVKYAMLTKNLGSSKKTGTIELREITYIMKASDFMEYLNHDGYLKRLSGAFRNWMKKKKVKFTLIPFQPNLLGL